MSESDPVSVARFVFVLVKAAIAGWRRRRLGTARLSGHVQPPARR